MRLSRLRIRQAHQVKVLVSHHPLVGQEELVHVFAQVGDHGHAAVARLLAGLAHSGLLIGLTFLDMALGQTYLVAQLSTAQHPALNQQDAAGVIQDDAAGSAIFS